MWSSNSLKSTNSVTCLSSIILDTSDHVPHKNTSQSNRFVYRFMRQVHDDDDLDPSSLGKDLESSLKIGDYVVIL